MKSVSGIIPLITGIFEQIQKSTVADSLQFFDLSSILSCHSLRPKLLKSTCFFMLLGTELFSEY